MGGGRATSDQWHNDRMSLKYLLEMLTTSGPIKLNSVNPVMLSRL
jgi:hypothetical protein